MNSVLRIFPESQLSSLRRGRTHRPAPAGTGGKRGVSSTDPEASWERDETVPVPVAEPSSFSACSPEMERLLKQVRSIAPQNTTILLSGETGRGKSRLARLIHEMSPGREKPFLVLNCGALSASLIESELFGHARGAYTGAHRSRTGKFAKVGNGTLLLDEIDALPLPLQAKLL